MKALYKSVSWAGLLLTIVPSFLVFSGNIGSKTNQWLMFAGLVLWFASAPFWIGKKP